MSRTAIVILLLPFSPCLRDIRKYNAYFISYNIKKIRFATVGFMPTRIKLNIWPRYPTSINFHEEDISNNFWLNLETAINISFFKIVLLFMSVKGYLPENFIIENFALSEILPEQDTTFYNFLQIYRYMYLPWHFILNMYNFYGKFSIKFYSSAINHSSNNNNIQQTSCNDLVGMWKNREVFGSEKVTRKNFTSIIHQQSKLTTIIFGPSFTTFLMRNVSRFNNSLKK